MNMFNFCQIHFRIHLSPQLTNIQSIMNYERKHSFAWNSDFDSCSLFSAVASECHSTLNNRTYNRRFPFSYTDRGRPSPSFDVWRQQPRRWRWLMVEFRRNWFQNNIYFKLLLYSSAAAAALVELSCTAYWLVREGTACYLMPPLRLLASWLPAF